MLACTEMITMCLHSGKQKHLRAQQQQQQPPQCPPYGLPIFKDIFRRADKNDDGKLSFEEFNAYFADGILTTEELRELFYSIDGRQNNNLDTDKLSDYFAQHLGEYLNVLSALETLNIVILKAMDNTKEVYQGSSVLGQFVTRFMLRETSTQLLSLQMSLQCAMEALEEQSSPAPREVKAEKNPSAQRNGRRCGRQVLNDGPPSHSYPGLQVLNDGPPSHSYPGRQVLNDGPPSHSYPGLQVLNDGPPSHSYPGLLTTGVTMETDDHWCSQINRLQLLLDKLEWQSPKLEPLREDTLAGTYKSNILLVQRQMSAMEEDLEEFQKALRSYVDATSNQCDNLHVSVQKLPGKSCYIIYEFWQDRISWMSYLQSNDSKDFQRCVVDILEDPELVSTMLLPASWWIMTNN